MNLKFINCKILPSFWKVYLLHPATQREVSGQWMLKELGVEAGWH